MTIAMKNVKNTEVNNRYLNSYAGQGRAAHVASVPLIYSCEHKPGYKLNSVVTLVETPNAWQTLKY